MATEAHAWLPNSSYHLLMQNKHKSTGGLKRSITSDDICIDEPGVNFIPIKLTINALQLFIKKHDDIMVISPTGTGKSLLVKHVLKHITDEESDTKKRVKWISCYRNKQRLIDGYQKIISETLDQGYALNYPLLYNEEEWVSYLTKIYLEHIFVKYNNDICYLVFDDIDAESIKLIELIKDNIIIFCQQHKIPKRNIKLIINSSLEIDTKEFSKFEKIDKTYVDSVKKQLPLKKSKFISKDLNLAWVKVIAELEYRNVDINSKNIDEKVVLEKVFSNIKDDKIRYYLFYVSLLGSDPIPKDFFADLPENCDISSQTFGIIRYSRDKNYYFIDEDIQSKIRACLTNSTDIYQGCFAKINSLIPGYDKRSKDDINKRKAYVLHAEKFCEHANDKIDFKERNNLLGKIALSYKELGNLKEAKANIKKIDKQNFYDDFDNNILLEIEILIETNQFQEVRDNIKTLFTNERSKKEVKFVKQLYYYDYRAAYYLQDPYENHQSLPYNDNLIDEIFAGDENDLYLKGLGLLCKGLNGIQQFEIDESNGEDKLSEVSEDFSDESKHVTENKLKEILKNLTEAASCITEELNPEQHFYIQMKIGTVYRKLALYAVDSFQALHYFKEAEKILKETLEKSLNLLRYYHHILAKIYANLSSLYAEHGLIEQAKECANNEIRIKKVLYESHTNEDIQQPTTNLGCLRLIITDLYTSTKSNYEYVKIRPEDNSLQAIKSKKRFCLYKILDAIQNDNLNDFIDLVNDPSGYYKINSIVNTLKVNFLHIATGYAALKIIRYLMAGKHQDELLAHKDNNGCTPFYKAVSYGNHKVVEYLINLANDEEKLINTTDEAGYTPMHICVYMGYVNIANLLLRNKKVDLTVREKICHKTAYEYAVDLQNQDFVNLLENPNNDTHKAKEKTIKKTTKAEASAQELLLLAIANRNMDEVIRIYNDHCHYIQFGLLLAKSNELDPMALAITTNQPEIVNFFIQKQRNISERVENDWAWSYLHRACGLGYVEIVDLLLRNEEFFIKKSKSKVFLTRDFATISSATWTALHVAVCTSSASRDHIVRMLLQKNPLALEITEENGETPLFFAVKKRHVSTVQLLLEYGACPYRPNGEGISPYAYAKANQLNDIVFLFDEVRKKKMRQSLLVEKQEKVTPLMQIVNNFYSDNDKREVYKKLLPTSLSSDNGTCYPSDIIEYAETKMLDSADKRFYIRIAGERGLDKKILLETLGLIFLQKNYIPLLIGESENETITVFGTDTGIPSGKKLTNGNIQKIIDLLGIRRSERLVILTSKQAISDDALKVFNVIDTTALDYHTEKSSWIVESKIYRLIPISRNEILIYLQNKIPNYFEMNVKKIIGDNTWLGELLSIPFCLTNFVEYFKAGKNIDFVELLEFYEKKCTDKELSENFSILKTYYEAFNKKEDALLNIVLSLMYSRFMLKVFCEILKTFSRDAVVEALARAIKSDELTMMGEPEFSILSDALTYIIADLGIPKRKFMPILKRDNTDYIRHTGYKFLIKMPNSMLIDHNDIILLLSQGRLVTYKNGVIRRLICEKKINSFEKSHYFFEKIFTSNNPLEFYATSGRKIYKLKLNNEYSSFSCEEVADSNTAFYLTQVGGKLLAYDKYGNEYIEKTSKYVENYSLPLLSAISAIDYEGGKIVLYATTDKKIYIDNIKIEKAVLQGGIDSLDCRKRPLTQEDYSVTAVEILTKSHMVWATLDGMLHVFNTEDAHQNIYAHNHKKISSIVRKQIGDNVVLATNGSDNFVTIWIFSTTGYLLHKNEIILADRTKDITLYESPDKIGLSVAYTTDYGLYFMDDVLATPSEKHPEFLSTDSQYTLAVNNKNIYAADKQGYLYIWSKYSYQILSKIKITNFGVIYSMLITPDNKYLLLLNEQREIIVLDTQTNRIVQNYQLQFNEKLTFGLSTVANLVMSDNGNEILVTLHKGSYETIQYLPNSEEILKPCVKQFAPIQDWKQPVIAALSCAGNYYLAGSDGEVCAMDQKTHQTSIIAKSLEKFNKKSSLFCLDSATLKINEIEQDYIFCADQDGRIYYFEAGRKTSDKNIFYSQNKPIYSLTTSPDNRWLACVNGNQVDIFDLADFCRTKKATINISLKEHVNEVYKVEFTDSNTLYATGADGMIVEWRHKNQWECAWKSREIEMPIIKEAKLISSDSNQSCKVRIGRRYMVIVDKDGIDINQVFNGKYNDDLLTFKRDHPQRYSSEFKEYSNFDDAYNEALIRLTTLNQYKSINEDSLANSVKSGQAYILLLNYDENFNAEMIEKNQFNRIFSGALDVAHAIQVRTKIGTPNYVISSSAQHNPKFIHKSEIFNNFAPVKHDENGCYMFINDADFDLLKSTSDKVLYYNIYNYFSITDAKIEGLNSNYLIVDDHKYRYVKLTLVPDGYYDFDDYQEPANKFLEKLSYNLNNQNIDSNYFQNLLQFIEYLQLMKVFSKKIGNKIKSQLIIIFGKMKKYKEIYQIYQENIVYKILMSDKKIEDKFHELITGHELTNQQIMETTLAIAEALIRHRNIEDGLKMSEAVIEFIDLMNKKNNADIKRDHYFNYYRRKAIMLKSLALRRKGMVKAALNLLEENNEILANSDIQYLEWKFTKLSCIYYALLNKDSIENNNLLNVLVQVDQFYRDINVIRDSDPSLYCYYCARIGDFYKLFAFFGGEKFISVDENEFSLSIDAEEQENFKFKTYMIYNEIMRKMVLNNEELNLNIVCMLNSYAIMLHWSGDYADAYAQYEKVIKWSSEHGVVSHYHIESKIGQILLQVRAFCEAIQFERNKRTEKYRLTLQKIFKAQNCSDITLIEDQQLSMNDIALYWDKLAIKNQIIELHNLIMKDEKSDISSMHEAFQSLYQQLVNDQAGKLSYQEYIPLLYRFVLQLAHHTLCGNENPYYHAVNHDRQKCKKLLDNLSALRIARCDQPANPVPAHHWSAVCA